MKKLFTLICAGVFMSALGVTFSACTDGLKSSGQEGKDVPFTVYSFGEGTTAQWVNLDYEREGKILVINSDEEMKNYVEGDYPEINFSEKTLVLTCGGAINGIEKIDAKITCEDNEYLLRIFVNLNMTDVAERWNFAVAIPKLSEQRQVKLNVKYERP